MNEVDEQRTAFSRRRAVRLALFLLAIAVLGALLPTTAAQASPVSTVKNGLSLSLDGQVAFAGVPAAPAVSPEPQGSVATFTALAGNGVPVVLGAPGQATAVFGDCKWYQVWCSVPRAVVTVTEYAGCLNPITGVIFWDTATCRGVRDNVVKVFKQATAWVVSKVIQAFISQQNEWAKKMALGTSHWVIHDLLGSSNTVTSPTLACKFASGDPAKNCEDSWFIGQLKVMRSLGLFFLVPLLMLVIIQSVVKGSMFFMVRAICVMLPVAVIGSAVLVALAQLLLNISDDLADGIAKHTTSADGFGKSMEDAINNLDADSFGLFTFLWLIFFVLAAIVIFVELVLREVGVYLTALFLPFAFMAMVWPPCAKWAKRLTELLIGLIFSKVFIVMAVSLGMAAIGHSGASATDKAAGEESKNEAATASVMGGAVILLMAGFAGTKILAITPAAMHAAEGRVMAPGRAFTKGQWLSNTLLGREQRRQQKLEGIEPKAGGWRNGAANSTPTPSGSGSGGSGTGGGGGGTGGGGGGGRHAAGGTAGSHRPDYDGKHRAYDGKHRAPEPPSTNGDAARNSQGQRQFLQGQMDNVAKAYQQKHGDGAVWGNVTDVRGHKAPDGMGLWKFEGGKASAVNSVPQNTPYIGDVMRGNVPAPQPNTTPNPTPPTPPPPPPPPPRT